MPYAVTIDRNSLQQQNFTRWRHLRWGQAIRFPFTSRFFLRHTQRTEVEVAIVSHRVWWTETQAAYTIICLLTHSLTNPPSNQKKVQTVSLCVLDAHETNTVAWLRRAVLIRSFLQTPYVCATRMSQHCSTSPGVCVTEEDWHPASPHSSYTPAAFGPGCSTWDWYTVLM